MKVPGIQARVFPSFKALRVGEDAQAIPDVVYTDPRAVAVRATEAPFSATVPVSEVAKTATYTRAASNGFLSLLSDGDRLTGGCALGPEAGEWMQQPSRLRPLATGGLD